MLRWFSEIPYPFPAGGLFVRSSDWEPDTDNSLFEYLTNFIDARLAELPPGSHVAGLFWMQGNGDGNFPQPAKSYTGNLAYFVKRFRDRYGDVPVVLESGSPLTGVTYGDVVRDRQERAVAHVDGLFLADSSDLPLRDDQHYTADAYIALGKLMADVMPACPCQ
jgi:hypothetical protein